LIEQSIVTVIILRQRLATAVCDSDGGNEFRHTLPSELLHVDGLVVIAESSLDEPMRKLNR